jgi:sulfite reductase (ferredoxin)
MWVDGEKIKSLPPAGESLVKTGADDPIEPLYGKSYLPRKFKTAFALPEDNCTDIHANDLGYLGIVKEGCLAGYNVLVGGGLGTTNRVQHRLDGQNAGQDLGREHENNRLYARCAP